IGLDLEVPSNLKQNVKDLRPDEPYVPPGTVEFFNKCAGPSLSARRRVTSNGGILRCVMRLPHFVNLVGFVEVAASAGWSFNYDDSIYLRTASERFPALSFHAVAPGAFEVDGPDY